MDEGDYGHDEHLRRCAMHAHMRVFTEVPEHAEAGQ
jgi:hypothetical protein